MPSQAYSMSELLDLAVDKLPPLRRRVAKFRLSASRRYRNNVLDQLCIYCCDNPECAAIMGTATADGLMSGEISATDSFNLDLDQLERFLQILIEYLPKLLEIILPLFMQLVWVLLAFSIAGSSANAQCSVDPITGQMKCQPIKKVLSTTAAVAGKTVSAVGAAITTPDCICGPNCQCDVGGTPCPCPRIAVVSTSVASSSYSPSYSSIYSTGWSKSWHKVHGQPVRNAGRRLLGR